MGRGRAHDCAPALAPHLSCKRCVFAVFILRGAPPVARLSGVPFTVLRSPFSGAATPPLVSFVIENYSGSPACASTPLICSKSMKSAVPHSGTPSCTFVVLRALRVLPKTFHAFPSTPPVARLPRVLFSVHCSLFSRAAMPPLRSPGRASAPCTLAKDRAFPSLKSKQPHHPPHHTPSPKPVIGFPILPTPHPSRTVSHPLTSHLNTIG